MILFTIFKNYLFNNTIKWLIALLIIINLPSAAATIPVYITSPSQIAACDSNRFQASFVTGSSFSFRIRAFIPGNGSIYNYTCQDPTDVFPIKVMKDVNSTNISTPVFDPADSSWVITVLDTGSITFNYYVLVDCSVIQDSSSTTSLDLHQVWTCVSCSDTFDLGGSNHITDDNIVTPNIVDVTGPLINASYQNSASLIFRYQNVGTAIAPMWFRFNPDPLVSNCVAYNSSGLFYGISDTAGVFATWFSLNANTWTLDTIPLNCSLGIKDSIIVVNCLDSCSNQKALFEWRCALSDTTDIRLCKNCQNDYESTYTISTPTSWKAKIKLERINPSFNAAKADKSCPGDFVHWEYRIINTGIEDIPETNFNLHYHPNDDKINYLTLIPRDSVILDASACPSCSIDTLTVLETNYLCASVVSDPLNSYSMIIHELGGGDTVTFSFATYKCSSEDDTLFNTPKLFNHWAIEISGQDSCGVDVDIVPATPGNEPFQVMDTPNKGYISTHSNSQDSDLNLELEFIPTLSDLTVPQGPAPMFGPYANLFVNLHGLFPNTLDYQLVGCYPPDTCNMNGYLRAQIHCQQGLRIENHISEAYLYHPISGVMNPIYFYSAVLDSTCVEGDYYYYFDLNDTAAFNVINSGKFQFRLQSCCTSIEPTNYSVSFSIVPDPNNCFSLGPQSVDTTPPQCTDCVWIPLSSKGNHINVHCPGCVIPGIIIDSYRMERLTYGFTDSTNDRLADNSMSVIEKDSSYFVNHDIRYMYSMHGDYVQDLMVAHFEPGQPDTSGYGYSYAQMLDSGAVLNFLQLRRSIGGSTPNLMDMHPVGLNLYIDIPDSDSLNCIDCNLFNMPDNNFYTVQINTADSISISNFLQVVTNVDSNYYFFSFDVNALGPHSLDSNITYQDSLNPFTVFAEGQQYRLQVIYRNCGNFLPPNVINAESDDGVMESDIGNNMYLMGQDGGVYGIENFGEATSYFPATVTQAFADTNRFVCEIYGGRHFFVSNSAFNTTNLQFVDGQLCNRQIWADATCIIGGNGKIDRFPYEFRTPVFHANNFEIAPVPGFIRSNPRIVSIYRGKDLNPNTSPANLISVSTPLPGAPYIITSGDYNSINCITQIPVNPTDSSLYFADQYGMLRVIIDITPDTCALGYVYYPDTTLSIIQFSDVHQDCQGMNDSAICGSNSFVNYNQFYPDIHLPYPILTLTNDSTSFLGQVCWNVTYFNASVDSLGGYGHSTAASFVFLHIPDSVDIPQLGNWQFTDSLGTTIYPDSFGVFHISPLLLPNGEITGQLCATVIYCDELDSVNIDWGWNCGNYPTNMDSLCFGHITNLGFSPPEGSISSPGKIFQPPVTLCDTLTFGATFNSNDVGIVFLDSLVASGIHPFLNIVGATLKVCNSTLSVSLTDTVPNWVITDSMLTVLGFSNGGLELHDSLCIYLHAILECGFKNDPELPTLNLWGHGICDTLLNATASYAGVPVVWDSTICADCFSITKTANMDTVIAVTDTVIYNITVCAYNDSAQIINLMENLPSNFDLVSTNFQTIDTIPGDTCVVYKVTGTFLLGGPCIENYNSAAVSTLDSTFSDSTCVTVMPSCFDWSYTFIPDSAFSSSYPSSISNDTLFINGVFFIDSSLTLLNCKVYANAGAQIVVLPLAIFTLDSSSIEGCDVMWRGIWLDERATGRILESSTLRDAEIGIFASNKSTHKIAGSSIEDCVRGVYLPPNSALNMITSNIYGSKFGLFAAALKPGYPGQIGFGNIPYSGIELNDVTLQIGYSTLDSNYFYNLNEGISGYRSALTVENNKFSLIHSDSYYSDPWNGSAIVSIGNFKKHRPGDLIILPLSSGNETILNCLNGVYTEYSSLNIQGVRISNVVTGIFSMLCKDLLQSYVRGCTIDARLFGINWIKNIGSSLMRAEYNRIIMAGTHSIGISMEESSTAARANYIVENNYITIDEGVKGIKSQSTLSAIINHNEVRLMNTPTINMQGISLYASDSSSVNCNTIIGDNALDTLKSGIHVDITKYGTFTCNNTDSTGFGVFFGGGCDESKFRGNIMNHHYDGLRLNSVAEIDTQTQSGNSWLASSHYGAVNFNASSSIQLAKSLFIVDTSISAFVPTFPGTSIPGWPDDNGWFVILSGNAYECNFVDCGSGGGEGRDGSEELKMMIANDSVLTSDYIPESKSIAKEYLYELLKKDNNITSTNSTLEGFVDENTTSAIGYLYEVKQELSEKYSYDSLIVTNLQYLRNNIHEIQDSLLYLDSLQMTNPLLNIFFQRENLILQLNIYEMAFDSTLSQHEASKATILSLAAQQNTLIQSQAIPEINQKFLNQMEIMSAEFGIDTIASHLTELQLIASQCPYSGGTAVFRARTFVSLFIDSTSYDDQNVCFGESYYRNSVTNSINDIYILMKPNPANQEVEFILQNKLTGVCKISILNSANQLVLNHLFNCTEKSTTVNTSTLKPGVYTVHMIADENFMVSEKLIILR